MKSLPFHIPEAWRENLPGYGAVEGGNALRKLKEAYARRKTKIKPLKETNLGLAPKGERIQYLYRLWAYGHEHPKWRISMGLTDRRKTAKNLADSRKNLKNLTVSRK